MKKKSIFILPFALFLFACNNKSSDANDTGLETTTDNVVLKCDSLFVLDGWIEKFKNAKPKHTELLGKFEATGATFKVECNSLYLDENNSIIVSACVKLIKGSKGSEFHGYIHRDQFNQQNDDNVKTYTIASIDYTKKQGGSLKSEMKEYTLYSDGKIEELVPTAKKTFYK